MKTTMSQGETVSHTPGPWKFHIGRGIDPRFHVQTVGGYQIAETPKNGLACGIKEVNEANARLIAAAPDLLEACKVAFANLKNLYSSDHLVIKSLRNALEKAGAL